jgi:hypothetical protein
MQPAPDIDHCIPQKKENLRGLPPRGGVGVFWLKLREKSFGSLNAYATHNSSKLALVSIHLPSNVTNSNARVWVVSMRDIQISIVNFKHQ